MFIVTLLLKNQRRFQLRFDVNSQIVSSDATLVLAVAVDIANCDTADSNGGIIVCLVFLPCGRPTMLADILNSKGGVRQ